MAETLTVHVNREGIHSVEAPGDIESPERLSIEIRNHGEPTHVHLRLDGDLATVATLGATNLYIEGDRRVVELTPSGVDSWPVSGTLEVATGYGQESAITGITLTEVEPDDQSEPAVNVVEESAPSDSGPGTGAPGGLTGAEGPSLVRRALPVVLLAVLAVALAALAVQVGGQGAMIGAGVVIVAVIIAGYLLYRG